MFPSLTDNDASLVLSSVNYDIDACVDKLLHQSYNRYGSERLYASLSHLNEPPPADPELEEFMNNCKAAPDQVSSKNQNPEEMKPLGVILKSLAEDTITSEEYVRFKVRRYFVWQDAKPKLLMASKNNDWAKCIKVEFFQDPAIDEAGPRREFISLIHKFMHHSTLFTGVDGKKCFADNFQSLRDHDYELYGKLRAWSVLQGCPPPNFLASPVVDFIVYGNLQQVTYDIDSIPEKDIREKLHNLNAIQDEDLFKKKATANTDI